MTEAENLSKEMAQLKKDLNALQTDVAGVAKALKAAGAEEGRNAYNQAKNRGEALYAQGEVAAGSAAGMVGAKIDENPLTSVFTAFGVGFIVGSLLGHRRG